MATRELRPRKGKITDSFNASKPAADTSKLVVNKRGGPQKFANAATENPSGKSVTSTPEPSSTTTQTKSPSKSSSSSRELATPPAEHEPEGNPALDSSTTSPLSSPPLPETPPPANPPKSKSKSKPKSKPQPAKKKNKLKYPPGTTPYPDLAHPTPAECIEVAALLTAAHGPAIRPETVPKPDNSVSGCGEVPSVLDALARTVLSANTSNGNSSRAFKGLLDAFGMVPHETEVEAVKEEEGEMRIKMARRIGQGSVEWGNVRRASMKDVVEAIKAGGLAVMKAKHIKNILDVAWEEGRALERVKREEGVKKEDRDEEGIKNEADEEDRDVSLEYLRGMGDDEVMAKLMSFDGVGCKTASCVAMFCLGRPKFPVDTHVWRISKYLSWVPENATREDTYHHLDTRIPNDLKYSLHCLLIRHGHTCKHCKAGPQAATPAKTKTVKRPRSDEGDDEGESPGKRMKTKKVWVGTGMMKEVVVEVPDDGIENGPEEESLEACVLEQLIERRVRKLRKV